MKGNADAPGPGLVERRIPPLALALLVGAGMWTTSRLGPTLAVSIPGSRVAALVLAVSGAALALAGIVAFRRAGTTVNPLTPGAASTMVRTGVYRVSRNPMYVGVMAALLAWALWLSHVVALLWLPVVFAWLDRVQIPAEERGLGSRFGEEFDSYRRSVRRWL